MERKAHHQKSYSHAYYYAGDPGQQSKSLNTTARTTAGFESQVKSTWRSKGQLQGGSPVRGEQQEKQGVETAVEWFVQALTRYGFRHTKISHVTEVSKSDYESYRKEFFVLKDTIPKRKKALLHDLKQEIQQHFRKSREQFNAEVDLRCALAKEDIYEPLIAVVEEGKETMVQGFGNEVLVLLFERPGEKLEMEVEEEDVKVARVEVKVVQKEEEEEDPTQYKMRQVNESSFQMEVSIDSDIFELYQFDSLPKMMLVRSDMEVHYIGGVLNINALQREIELIKELVTIRTDRLEGFRLVEKNVGSREKKDFIAFLKKMEETFAENISQFLSWKITFSEQVTYTISGEAKRFYNCNLHVVVLEENEFSGQNLADMVRQLTRYWCKSQIHVQSLRQWDLVKVKQAPIKMCCFKCQKEIFGTMQNERYYACVQCNPCIVYCKSCGDQNQPLYREYHNQFQRENLMHHEHSLVVLNSHRNTVSKQKIIFYTVSNQLNELYWKGKEAMERGDYTKQDIEVPEQFACDFCEKEIHLSRFTCLNCRQLTLCESCVDKDTSVIVDNELESAYSKFREHRSNHVFLRIWDYQTAKIAF